jgi:hypothetical protein
MGIYVSEWKDIRVTLPATKAYGGLSVSKKLSVWPDNGRIFRLHEAGGEMAFIEVDGYYQVQLYEVLMWKYVD